MIKYFYILWLKISKGSKRLLGFIYNTVKKVTLTHLILLAILFILFFGFYASSPYFRYEIYRLQNKINLLSPYESVETGVENYDCVKDINNPKLEQFYNNAHSNCEEEIREKYKSITSFNLKEHTDELSLCFQDNTKISTPAATIVVRDKCTRLFSVVWKKWLGIKLYKIKSETIKK